MEDSIRAEIDSFLMKQVLFELIKNAISAEGGGSGAGIGLTRVYGIIQKHSGAVGIKTEKDKGTAFSVYLRLSGEK
jgi:K+-sensing histidine kinase KdpD